MAAEAVSGMPPHGVAVNTVTREPEPVGLPERARVEARHLIQGAGLDDVSGEQFASPTGQRWHVASERSGGSGGVRNGREGKDRAALVGVHGIADSMGVDV